MEIAPLKQQFYHSCLVTCLLMVSKMSDQSIEQRVFCEGEKRRFDYYLNGILESFVDNTMLSVEVIVDNKTFADELTKGKNKKNKRIKIRSEKITIKMIEKLLETSAIILHVDNHFLGDYSHVSHYVVVTAFKNDMKIELVDPIDGKSRYLTKEKLEASIDSLRNNIKMCPVIVRKI